MRSKILYGFMIAFILCLSLYEAPSASAASAEEEVLQVENNWIKAFNTMDFGLMSSLYWRSSKTSSFPPNELLYQGWDHTSSMLKGNFQSPAGTLAWTLHNPQITMLPDNIAILTEYHILISTDPKTNAQTVDQLRVTRVMQKIDGKWLIVHDHGSGLPVK
jgi:ketosteroid isomerase-like protein